MVCSDHRFSQKTICHKQGHKQTQLQPIYTQLFSHTVAHKPEQHKVFLLMITIAVHTAVNRQGHHHFSLNVNENPPSHSKLPSSPFLGRCSSTVPIKMCAQLRLIMLRQCLLCSSIHCLSTKDDFEYLHLMTALRVSQQLSLLIPTEDACESRWPHKRAPAGRAPPPVVPQWLQAPPVSRCQRC